MKKINALLVASHILAKNKQNKNMFALPDIEEENTEGSSDFDDEDEI